MDKGILFLGSMAMIIGGMIGDDSSSFSGGLVLFCICISIERR